MSLTRLCLGPVLRRDVNPVPARRGNAAVQLWCLQYLWHHYCVDAVSLFHASVDTASVYCIVVVVVSVVSVSSMVPFLYRSVPKFLLSRLSG